MEEIFYIVIAISVFSFIFYWRNPRSIRSMTKNEKIFIAIYQIVCFAIPSIALIASESIGDGKILYIFGYSTIPIVIAIFFFLEIIFVIISKCRKIIFKNVITEYALIVGLFLVGIIILITTSFVSSSQVKLENIDKEIVVECHRSSKRNNYIIYEKINIFIIRRIDNVRVDDHNFTKINNQGYEIQYYENGFVLFFGYVECENCEGETIMSFYKYSEDHEIVSCQEDELIKW